VMARVRFGSCDDESLRSDLTELSSKLSSSWPVAVPLPRQACQPPQAPLPKPSKVSWEVPRFTLPRSPRLMSRSCSDTTLGEDYVGTSFTTCGDDWEETEPLVFMLTGAPSEDDASDEEGSWDDLQHMVGLDDRDEEASQKVQAIGENDLMEREVHCGADDSGDPVVVGASHTLQSVLIQVAEASRRSEQDRASAKHGSSDRDCSSSWRPLLQPPKAPLRRPSAAPFEVLPFTLPMSSPCSSPRDEMNFSRSISISSFEKVETPSSASCNFAVPEGREDEEEDEAIIFNMDEAEESENEHDDCVEEDEEGLARKYHIDMTSLETEPLEAIEGSDIEFDVDEATIGLKDRVLHYGASPMLLSVLTQVAAEATGYKR